MARSDFNQYALADNNFTLGTAKSTEGSGSLETQALNVDPEYIGAEILKISENDSPTEARIQTQLWIPSSQDENIQFFFRFQDVDNWYAVTIASLRGTYVRLELSLVEAGSYSLEDSIRFGVDFQDLDNALSDGTTDMTAKWVPLRCDFWVDSGGDLRGRLLEDLDGDGNYTQIENDVTHTTPTHGSGGGVGIGKGEPNTDLTDGTLYWDETEIYY